MALGECDLEFPFQVPQEQYFVVGDMRESSIDSRNSLIGCVPKDQIVGKVFFRVLIVDTAAAVRIMEQYLIVVPFHSLGVYLGIAAPAQQTQVQQNCLHFTLIGVLPAKSRRTFFASHIYLGDNTAAGSLRRRLFFITAAKKRGYERKNNKKSWKPPHFTAPP